jgi:NAD+ diphosphatase
MTVSFAPDVQLPAGHSAPPRYVAVQGDRVLVHRDGDRARFPAAPPDGVRHVLGMLGDTPCVAIDVEEDGDVDGLQRVDLRELFGLVSELDWSLAGRAVQIVAWDHQHRFCGRCATPTEPSTTERVRRCPHCGLSVYPRVTPAIIVLVTRGAHDEQALLAWGRRSPIRRYSTLAGFVEAGEGLEEAVRREVREEVGVELSEITYFGSQPWPFPSQLMVGFRARYRSGPIVIQESEIVEARWFTAAEVLDVTASRGRFSISGWLIDGWIAEQRQARTS